MKKTIIKVVLGAVMLSSYAITNSAASKTAKSVVASVYWQPQETFCGGRFNPKAITFADRTSKCGQKARITAANGRSVVAVRNDKGPFVKERHLDLSEGTANAIGLGRSVHLVQIEYMD